MDGNAASIGWYKQSWDGPQFEAWGAAAHMVDICSDGVAFTMFLSIYNAPLVLKVCQVALDSPVGYFFGILYIGLEGSAGHVTCGSEHLSN